MEPTCQICLEALYNDSPKGCYLANICGKSCRAKVCQQCLGRHVEVSLQQFYAGVLPRVRCPICLVDMHMSQWTTKVPSEVRDNLVARYSELCRQTCILTPPCCHKSNYSHLPTLNEDSTASIPIKLLPSQLTKFQTLCKQFCRHKLPPRAVLDYGFNTFGEKKAVTLLNELTLPRIVDVERRATLLLSLMYLRPNTKTLCCGANFCFNCKRSGHHDSCEEEFDEGTSLVRCRSCRILVLKVEGCNAVTCVCGFYMEWSLEVTYRSKYKKKLLPIDMFDIPLFQTLQRFQYQLSFLQSELDRRRLRKLTELVAPKLRPFIIELLWRRRYHKAVLTGVNKKWQSRRDKKVVELLSVAKPVFKPFAAACIWRWRFRRALLTKMEPEFYWKAYNRWHPEETDVADEEISSILSIGAFDEE